MAACHIEVMAARHGEVMAAYHGEAGRVSPVCARTRPAHLAFVHGLLERDELPRQPPAGSRALAHTELARLLAPRLEPLDLILRRDRAAAAAARGCEIFAQLRCRAAVLLHDANARCVGAVVLFLASLVGGGGLVRPCEALNLDWGVAL